jgi:hypothetical protein
LTTANIINQFKVFHMLSIKNLYGVAQKAYVN